MRRIRRLAVLTVLHPVTQPYFAEMLASLRAQDDRDFVLYTVVEGVDHAWVREHTETEPDVVIVPGGATPAENRQLGVEAIRADGLDGIVFLDSDDRAASNRTAVSRALLQDHALVFNELIPFGGRPTGPLLSPRFAEGDRIGWTHILDSNCLGLSNTAARTSALAPGKEWADLIGPVVDWPFFTRTLFADHFAVFTSKTQTLYRQHRSNTCGIEESTPAKITRAIDVKVDHYRSLSSLHQDFGDRAHWFAATQTRLRADPQFAIDYVAGCQAHAPAAPLWWEVASYKPSWMSTFQ